MSRHIEIREAVREDTRVVDRWFEEERTRLWLGGPGWADQAMNRAEEQADRHALLALSEGVPVGFVDLEVDDATGSLALAVDPERRARGIGRAILAALAHDPRFEHVRTWRAGVESGNTASARMFAAAGYLPTGERDRDGFSYVEMPAVVARARGLLGRLLHGHGVSVIVTEVEAYGGVEDPASHAFTRTPRSEIMYGPAWRLYVYRSYGIHHCLNVVTGPTEQAAAVLIRAGRVVHGETLARQRRGSTVPEHRLASGPGNLAAALGITLDDLGTDLRSGPVHLGDRPESAGPVAAGPRVGVSKAADVPWRLWLSGDRTVSAYRRSPRAEARPRA